MLKKELYYETMKLYTFTYKDGSDKQLPLYITILYVKDGRYYEFWKSDFVNGGFNLRSFKYSLNKL